MAWREELFDRLSDQPCTGYGRDDSPATEPSALAALALAAFGQLDPARRVAEWFTGLQSPTGSVGVRANDAEPCWPTSLAVLTWSTLHQHVSSRPYQGCIDRAFQWIVSHQGVKLARQTHEGHDSTLSAWPWVNETHMWVEPTALHVLALKAIGRQSHSRTRDAVQMLWNRQLPQGGWNYGNTIVLGQPLRPHLQPTGLALLALSESSQKNVRRSVQYLVRELSPSTATSSLCWGLLGLAAQGQMLPHADQWLEACFHHTLKRDQSRHKLALIALALQRESNTAPWTARKVVMSQTDRNGTRSAESAASDHSARLREPTADLVTNCDRTRV